MGKRLTRRQGAGIDDISGILLDILGRLGQRRTGQSHETGTGGLEDTERTDQLEERVDTAGLGGAVCEVSQGHDQLVIGRWYLHLHNAVVGANIQNLTAKLMGQAGDSIQVLVLVAQSLAGRQVARVVFNFLNIMSRVLLLRLGGDDLAVVLQQLLEELGSENGDLGKQKLTLNESRFGIVQHSPDGNEIIQLAAGLLDNTVLALQHNGHAREIIDLSVANDQTVNVEAACGQNSGHAGQHTGLVLNQTVQDVAFRRIGRRHRSLVQNGRNGSGSIPLRGGIGDRQRQG